MFRLWAALGFRVWVRFLAPFFLFLIWGFRRFRVKYGDCAVWIKGLGVFRIAAKGVGCWTKTIIEILVRSGEQVLFFPAALVAGPRTFKLLRSQFQVSSDLSCKSLMEPESEAGTKFELPERDSPKLSGAGGPEDPRRQRSSHRRGWRQGLGGAATFQSPFRVVATLMGLGLLDCKPKA